MIGWWRLWRRRRRRRPGAGPGWGRAGLLAGVLGTHVAAMVAIEGMGWGDALWLTLTTATTVGYGDTAAQSGWGRAATALLLYGAGVYLLAELAGELLDGKRRRRERRRTGVTGARGRSGHVVVAGIPASGGEEYIAAFAEEAMRTERLGGRAVEVVGMRWTQGIPEHLAAAGIGFTRGEPTSRSALEAAGVRRAAAVVAIAEEGVARDDAMVAAVVGHARALAPEARIAAECVCPESRAWLRQAGADAVVRPVRAYAELTVRALCEPGTEAVLESQMTCEGGRLRRVDLDEVEEMVWGKRVAEAVVVGGGTLVGYVDPDGEARGAPGAEAVVRARALVVLEGPGEDAGRARRT